MNLKVIPQRFHFNEMEFRKQDVIIDGKHQLLEKKPFEDIFKFYSPPSIIVGSSGCGKTTICLDLIFKFGYDCSNIYYITATKESMTDNTISAIPKIFRRKPTFETISKVWEEIKLANETREVDPDSIYKIIQIIYGQEFTESLKEKMEAKRMEILKDNQKIWKNNQSNHVEDDSLCFFYEVVGRLIIEGAKQMKDLSEFTVKELSVINSFISKPNKTILILDDMTTELQSMSVSKNKVNYNGSFLSVKEAFNCLITDILTRARHYNVMVCIFVHNIDFGIDKSLISNIILLGDNVAQKILNAKSFSDDAKAIIRATKDHVFNNPNLKHYFLSVNLANNTFCCSIADLHTGEKLKLTPENVKLIEGYKKIISGLN